MRPTPACVAFVARTHWLVGSVIVVSIALLHWLTRHLPAVEFGTRTYVITGSLGALYLLGGTLVWFGAPLGRLVSRICALLYLARPQFGSAVWETMNTPEFQTHFDKRISRT
jgi:hypothetical protein